MKTMTSFILAALAATTLSPAITLADSQNQGYLVDMNGNIVTTSNTDLCWRDGDWTPARSIEPCDPNNKPVAAKPTAAVVAAAPAAAIPQPAAQAWDQCAGARLHALPDPQAINRAFDGR